MLDIVALIMALTAVNPVSEPMAHDLTTALRDTGLCSDASYLEYSPGYVTACPSWAGTEADAKAVAYAADLTPVAIVYGPQAGLWAVLE